MGWPPFTPVFDVLCGTPRAHDVLASWIEQRYGVPVIDIVIDEDPVAGVRLAVWLHTEAEVEAFRDATGNYDHAKQAAIAERAEHRVDLVIFCAAEPKLRDRALRGPGDDALTAAGAVLEHPGAVWKIYALLGRVYVFLHTDEQVAALRGTAQHARLADALWQLVHPYDPFGTVPRESFEPVLDSKQNLDENYRGNSYYYHR